MYRLLPRTIEKVRTFSRTASTLFKKAASTLFKKALLVGPYLEQSRKDCKITLDGCTRRRAHTQHIPLGGHGDVGELIKPMLKCLVPIHRSSGTSNFHSGFDVLPSESYRAHNLCERMLTPGVVLGMYPLAPSSHMTIRLWFTRKTK